MGNRYACRRFSGTRVRIARINTFAVGTHLLSYAITVTFACIRFAIKWRVPIARISTGAAA